MRCPPALGGMNHPRGSIRGEPLRGKMPGRCVGEPPMELVLYSKPGCHLCEGLEEKLAALGHLDFTLEVRDITTQPQWFAAYQYEIPVLCRRVVTANGVQEEALPRLSPRAPVAQVERLIQKYLDRDTAE